MKIIVKCEICEKEFEYYNNRGNLVFYEMLT